MNRIIYVMENEMTADDFDTLKEWIEAELEERKEKWSDVIYHNMTDEQLSKPWTDDVPWVYVWTKEFVYYQCDSEREGWYTLGCVHRNPPMENEK